MGFLKICVTLDALQLTPRLATGMTIGADIPPAWPAIIGAMVLGTKVVLVLTVRRRPYVNVNKGGGDEGAG
jgi:hypothetical protein